MKFVLSTILVLVVGMLGYGFYLKNSGNSDGEIIIGFGVLTLAFILMPLFIYHRYKNKDLKSFELKDFLNKIMEEDEKKS